MDQATWDPQQYLRHAGHRTRPFLDLLGRVPALPGTPPRIADLGCGAGNVTVLLADRWPAARITGLDTSADMLASAAEFAGPTAGGGSIGFAHADLSTWAPDEPYDLIVSNAALHWVPGHRTLLPALLEHLAPGGTFALQVPDQSGAASHRLFGELCRSARWRDRVGTDGSRHANVLGPSDYLELLTGAGCEVDAWETTYSQLLTGQDPVLDWTKGSTLRPVLTALADDPQAAEAFLTEYRDLLRAAYPAGPHGTVYPFRRVFAVAIKRR